MSHQGSISLYQPNDSIAYSSWVPQGAQLDWLKQQYHRFNGDSPALVLTPQFVASIHTQLLNNWPSMNLDCTLEGIQMWWETERVVRRFNVLNYPMSGVNVPPLAAQWNQSVNETDIYSPPLSAPQSSLYPGIPAPLNQPAAQSVTFAQFHSQSPNLGHYIPPPLHDMLSDQQQHAGPLVPFHAVVPDAPNYQIVPPHQAEVGNVRAVTPATETNPGLDGPPPSPNEPPATQPKKSKKSKVGDAQPQPSENDTANHKTVHKAAHLWSKSELNDVDFGAQADQELMEKNLSVNNRLATLNRLVLAAWDLLNEEEQRPWIDQAVELLSAEPSLEKKHKKAIKKFDRTAQAVLDEYANWSFYVLWGENDAKFGKTAVRGNSAAGDNFQTWYKSTYPDEADQFMDRLGEYSDYVTDLLNQKQSRGKNRDDTDVVDFVAAVNGHLPRASRDLINLDYEELNVHELRKRAHTIFVDLWKAAGWMSQKVPWSKIKENPEKYCNQSLLPAWWLFANPASSNANKETLKNMLNYLKAGSEGRLPVGHSFRFHPRDSSLAKDEDAMDEDNTPTIAPYNSGPSTSTIIPTIMNAATATDTANATPAPLNTAAVVPNNDTQQRWEEDLYEQNNDPATTAATAVAATVTTTTTTANVAAMHYQGLPSMTFKTSSVRKSKPPSQKGPSAAPTANSSANPANPTAPDLNHTTANATATNSLPSTPAPPTGRTLEMQHDPTPPPATATATAAAVTTKAPAAAATTTTTANDAASTAQAPAVATTINFPVPGSTPSAVDPLPAAAHSPSTSPLTDPDNSADIATHDPTNNLEGSVWPPPMTKEYVNSEAGKREALRRIAAGATAPGQRMASPPPTKPEHEAGKAPDTAKPPPVKRQPKPKKDKAGSGVTDSLQQGVVVRRTTRRNQPANEPVTIEVPTSSGNPKRTIEDVHESDQALGEPATKRTSGRKRNKPE